MKVTRLYQKPQDIVLVVKLIAKGNEPWKQTDLAKELFVSQSEISEGLYRLEYSKLYYPRSKSINRGALLDYLEHAIRYVFPQHPGAMTLGVPTAHSILPLENYSSNKDEYVWPDPDGKTQGHSVIPLYPSVPHAALRDRYFHELLGLVDVLRIGDAAARDAASNELRQRILINSNK